MEFEIINYLKNNSTKKEIKKNLIDLIFKEAKTKEEIGNSKYIIIPNSVTSIGVCAFKNCTGLTSITIPNSVIFINKYAFNNCISLTSISIPRKFKSDMNNIFKDIELSKVKIIYI